MFSHNSTNCVGLFEMIEEVKLSEEEEKWSWSRASVRFRPVAKRYNPEVNTAYQAKPGQTFLQEELWSRPVFDHRDHHAPRAKKEEGIL